MFLQRVSISQTEHVEFKKLNCLKQIITTVITQIIYLLNTNTLVTINLQIIFSNINY